MYVRQREIERECWGKRNKGRQWVPVQSVCTMPTADKGKRLRCITNVCVHAGVCVSVGVCVYLS